MTDKKVVKLKRSNEDIQEEIASFLGGLNLEKGGLMMLYCSDTSADDADYMMFSNYQPGMQEIVMTQMVQEYLRSMLYEVEE